MYVCMYVCMYNVCVYMYMLCVYVYMYMCIIPAQSTYEAWYRPKFVLCSGGFTSVLEQENVVQ